MLLLPPLPLPSHSSRAPHRAPPSPPLLPPLLQWARRGKLIMPAADGAGRRKSLDDPAFYSNQTCGPASFLSAMAAAAAEGSGDLDAGLARDQQQQQQQQAAGDAAAEQGGGAAAPAGAPQHSPHPNLKRIRTEAVPHGRGGGGGGGTPYGGKGPLLPLSPHGVLLPGLSPRFGDYRGQHGGGVGADGSGGLTRPIDHIFQFHKALRWG